jgi:hypothetical protein
MAPRAATMKAGYQLGPVSSRWPVYLGSVWSAEVLTNCDFALK